MSVEINSRWQRIQRTLRAGTEAPVTRLTRIMLPAWPFNLLTTSRYTAPLTIPALHSDYDGVCHDSIPESQCPKNTICGCFLR